MEIVKVVEDNLYEHFPERGICRLIIDTVKSIECGIFIEEHEDKWHAISEDVCRGDLEYNSTFITIEEFITKFEDKFDITSICFLLDDLNIFSHDFIRKHAKTIDFNVKIEYLDYKLIHEIHKNVEWWHLSMFYHLSIDFILEFRKYFDIKDILHTAIKYHCDYYRLDKLYTIELIIGLEYIYDIDVMDINDISIIDITDVFNIAGITAHKFLNIDYLSDEYDFSEGLKDHILDYYS